MTVRFKASHENFRRHHACYDTANSPVGIPTAPRPQGPFASCGDCPYPSHGFVCHGKEGDCLRTDMQKINQRRREKASC